MIQMEERHLQILRQILSQYPYAFFIFGSRVKGTQKRFSDVDLCYKEKIPSAVISKLEEDLEESNLPFKVDLVNWELCSDDFKKLIEKDMILFV
jgi:predicted nucleotidyltransferase